MKKTGFKQSKQRKSLPPRPHTLFAVRVYRAVLGIPLGEVRSYKWVAAKAGSPDACRAVGQILKRNPCPLIIPCHRVVKSNQEAGGYVYGRQRKKELLALEKEIAGCLISKK
jgi:O-6-methylguanine DNA methyltransferase